MISKRIGLSNVLGLATISIFILTGCVNPRALEPNKIVLLEAKDRGVYSFEREFLVPGISSTKTDKKGTTTTTEGEYRKFKFVCTDYGSDVVTVDAIQSALDAEVPAKGSLGARYSKSEGAATIGVRTAGTDALLKMMSKNCRIYAGGGITPLGMEVLQRRYQTTLATILAVEQLTGTVTAPAINLNSSSSFGSPEHVTKITDSIVVENEKVFVLKESIKKLKEEAIELKAALDKEYIPSDIDALKKSEKDTDKATYAAYLKAKKPYDTKNNEVLSTEDSLKRRIESLDTLNKLSSNINLTGNTSTNGNINVALINKPLSDVTVTHVANVVKEMIKTLNDQSYYREVCATVLLSNPTYEVEVNKDKSSLHKDCLVYFKNNQDKIMEVHEEKKKVLELKEDVLKLKEEVLKLKKNI